MLFTAQSVYDQLYSRNQNNVIPMIKNKNYYYIIPKNLLFSHQLENITNNFYIFLFSYVLNVM